MVPDDGVAFDDLAARERDAAQCCARAAHQADDGIVPQDRAMHLRRAHQTCRERAGIDHRRRLGRAEPSRDRDPAGQPRSRGRTAPGIVLRGVTAVGGQTPISPRIAELGGKLGMELEAPPRQTIERAAAAPVERQEATRFAGGCAGDRVTLDDDRQRAASACKVGDRGADRATAADHDALARAHTATVSGSPSRFQGRPHRAAWPVMMV